MTNSSNRSSQSLRKEDRIFLSFMGAVALISLSLKGYQLHETNTIYTPQFDIKSFSMSTFYFREFKADWEIGFSIKHFGTRYNFSYGNIYISVFYKDVLLTAVKAAPVQQSTEYGRLEAAFSNMLDDGIAKAIIGHKSFDEAISFTVEVRARVRVRKNNNMKPNQEFILRMHCKDVMGHFVSGSRKMAELVSNDKLYNPYCRGSLYPKV